MDETKSAPLDALNWEHIGVQGTLAETLGVHEVYGSRSPTRHYLVDAR